MVVTGSGENTRYIQNIARLDDGLNGSPMMISNEFQTAVFKQQIKIICLKDV